MFELLFGIIWTLICMPFMFIMLSGSENINFLACLMIWAFFGIGIAFITAGIRKILRNINTDKNGEECFGKVIDIETTGARVNGNDIYKTIVGLYIGSENRVAIIGEEIGFDLLKYGIGEYVLVKYYQNDINFIKSINETQVSPKIKQLIETDISFYKKEDINEYEKEDDKKYINLYSPEVKTKIKKISGVSNIIFAIFWLILITIITLGMYGFGDNAQYSVNGQSVTYEEFSQMLFPKIFLGVFFLVGIIILLRGIKHCFESNKEQAKINMETITKVDTYKNNNEDDDPIKNY